MPSRFSRIGARVHSVALTAAVVAAAAAVALTGCTAGPAPTPSPTPPQPSGDGVLRIGTLFTTGGASAAAAAGQTAAVNAAVRAIDAAGGVNGAPVEVINRNGGTAGDGRAETAFAELVERGADVVIGPSTIELAALLAPLAAQAGIPLISPAATGARPDGAEGLFRTVPSASVQAAALGATLADGAARVALVRTDDAAGQALASGIADGLAAHDSELAVEVIPGPDAAADAAQVAGASPDAVVVSGAAGDEGTAALLAALLDAGIAPDALWITGGSLTAYDDDAGALEGAHGIRSGVPTDPAFVAQVRLEDPGVRSFQNSADAYDATVLAALAAVIAGDDGGPSIAASLRVAAGGGIPCHSFGECLDVLTTETDVDYDGPSGSYAIDEAGDRPAAPFAEYLYDASNRPVLGPL